MKNNLLKRSMSIGLLLSFTLIAGTAQAQSDTNSYTVDGTTFTYGLTDLGASLEVQDARGVITRYLSNVMGQLTEEASAERGTTQYFYDAIGNVVKETRAGGLVLKRDFDEQNRVIKEAMKQNGQDRKVNRYSYDNCENGTGRMCKIVSNGNITKYAYNPKGQYTKVATKYTGEDAFETTRYDYNETGQLEKLHYPTGLIVRYHYSDENRVHKVTGRYDKGEDKTAFDIANNIRFDPETQQLTQLKFVNGLKTKLSYDDKTRIEAIETSQNGQLVDYAAYRLNDLNQINSITRLNGNESQSFVYDADGRLIEERRGDDLSTSQNISYRYDAVGNRTSWSNGQKTKSYNYAPDANRLDQIDRESLSYDERGNLLLDNSKRAFTYDVTNRMTGFYKGKKLKASYEYNAFGQRIRKTLHGSSSGNGKYHSLHFAYNPDGWLLSEKGQNNKTETTFARDYVWLGARPLAQIERRMRPDGTTHKANISYLHTDHLKAPRSASNAQGQIVWNWNADAFGVGQPQRDVDGDGNKTVIRLRFPGQYYDHDSGLFYNHWRDYDPKLGRYIQSDPIGLKGGINRYAYVGGNPVSYIDPKGLAYQTCTTRNTAGYDFGYEVMTVDMRSCSDGGNDNYWDQNDYNNLFSPYSSSYGTGRCYDGFGSTIDPEILAVCQAEQTDIVQYADLERSPTISTTSPLENPALLAVICNPNSYCRIDVKQGFIDKTLNGRHGQSGIDAVSNPLQNPTGGIFNPVHLNQQTIENLTYDLVRRGIPRRVSLTRVNVSFPTAISYGTDIVNGQRKDVFNVTLQLQRSILNPNVYVARSIFPSR